MKNQNLIQFPGSKSGASAVGRHGSPSHRAATEVEDLLAGLPDLQERMADVMDAIGDGFALYDQDDRLVLWNQRFAEIVHYAKPLLQPGAQYADILRLCADQHFQRLQVSTEERQEWIDQAIAFQNREGTYERQTKDGRHFLVARRRTHQGNVAVVWADITEKKKAELAASENEAVYKQLFETAVVGIALLDTRRVILANKAFLSLFGFDGREDVRSITDFERVLPARERDRIRKHLKHLLDGDASTVSFEFQCVPRNHVEIWVHASCSRVVWKGSPAVQATFLDISEKKEFQQQLVARNMESMAALAHGVAVEFHKTFAAVMAQMKLANMEAYAIGVEQVAELLDEAEQQGRVVYGLIERLLYLHKMGVPVRTSASVEALINDAIPLSENGNNVIPLRKARVRYKMDILAGLPIVRVDKRQMVIALGALIAKGAQSMPFGGTLTIRADRRAVTERSRQVKALPGDYVRISISDQGDGMTPEALERFFDPYITSPHKGGGFALSSAYTIVRQHGGAIAITSKPGKGTQVRVFLPVDGNESAGHGA